MASEKEPFLRVHEISKRFGGVHALSKVNMDVFPGEVLCLAGENGCGKSTLIKIISGVQPQDSGTIEISGKRIQSLTPLQAMKLGIQVIYQDFSVFPNLTVAENISMTSDVSAQKKLFSLKKSQHIAVDIMEKLGVSLPLDADVESLSVADRQLTAILRALASNAKLLIMDEPTTALTQNEVERLFSIVKKMQEAGMSIVFVSHKLEEVMKISTRVCILRSGVNVIDAPASGLNSETITEYMTGKHLDQSRHITEVAHEAKVVLDVNNLCVDYLLRNISFSVKEGEILGLTGLLGSGRTEVAEALFGLLPHQTGRISIDGKEVKISSINDAISAGIGYVPEDRLTQGLFLDKPISSNVIAASIDQHTKKKIVLEKKKINGTIQTFFERLKIKAPNVRLPVRSLSGGNAQRVVLAKWLARSPRVLILNGPTVGVDVGSKAEILEILRDEARCGRAILLISDDVPEMVACCHRILVINHGEIRESLEGDITEELVREKVTA